MPSFLSSPRPSRFMQNSERIVQNSERIVQGSPRLVPPALGGSCGGKGLYRGTSLIKTRTPLEPYSRHMPRALWWPLGGGAVSFERGTPVVAPWRGGMVNHFVCLSQR
jgi:hypothetical protein